MRFRVDFYFITFLTVITFNEVVLIEKVDLMVRFTSFRLFWDLIFINGLNKFWDNHLIFWNRIRSFLLFGAVVLLICLNQHSLWFIWSILICISNWNSFFWEALAPCIAVLSIIIIKVTFIIIPINTCL